MTWLAKIRAKTPRCPSCGSDDTTTGRKVRLAAGLGLGVGLSLIIYGIGFFYPLGRILIPFCVLAGTIICAIPPLGKYCCLDCDAYWNPETPEIVWRTRIPGM